MTAAVLSHIIGVKSLTTTERRVRIYSAYSQDELRKKVQEILDDIKAGKWNRDEKPEPTPENTVPDDETG